VSAEGPKVYPAFRLKAKLRQGHQGYPFDVGTAWPKDRGAGFNLQLQPGVRIILADGTELTTGREGSCWMDLYDNRGSPPRVGGGSVIKHTTPPSDSDDPKDDIPF